MHSRFARALLLIAALWLPLQAVAGMTMTLCAHQGMATAPVTAGPCAHHHDGGAAMDAGAAGDAHAAHGHAADHGCQHCAVCHLAGAGYLLMAGSGVALLPSPFVFQPASVAMRVSHIPEPPQQPPKRSA